MKIDLSLSYNLIFLIQLKIIMYFLLFTTNKLIKYIRNEKHLY